MTPRVGWLVVLACAAAACAPNTPSTWTLNWMRDGEVDAFAPFETVDGDILTTVTTRIQDSALQGLVLSERRHLYDVGEQEVVRDTFTDWPARLRGSAERVTVRVDVSEDQPLEHADGTCQRVEWPEYDAEPDEMAIYWCRGIYAEETIWLGL